MPSPETKKRIAVDSPFGVQGAGDAASSSSKVSGLTYAIGCMGWLILLAYIFYEYEEFKGNFIAHILSFKPKELLFHFFMFFAPFVSTAIAFLSHEREKLYRETRASTKIIEDALSQWRATFDSMPYGVMLLDGQLRILRANQNMAEILGADVRSIQFKKCHEVFHPDGIAPEGCPTVMCKLSGNTESLEYFDSAKQKHFRLYSTPISSSDGNPAFFVHSVIDITEEKNREHELAVSRANSVKMLREIDLSYKELKVLYAGLIFSFANILDAKSPWTKGHSERVTAYAISIAREMNLEPKEIETLRTGAIFHDIGKIGTYDVILDKPDALTPEEYELVKLHPVKGAELFRHIKPLREIIPIIRHHHEKMDGSGYPDGLKGTDIPFLARLLCVADSFDSMTADRPYRPAPGREFAITELKRCSGTQFDPDVVEAFLRIL